MVSLAPGQKRRRILVVEDNPDNRLLVRSLLTRAGFAVQEAKNGEEAVALFRQWQFHFIWMDMRMPVMNGYEAARRIRALPGGDKIKIVALTASVFKEQHGEILAAGCDAVLHKPFRACELFSVMEEHLGVRYLYEEKLGNEAGKQAITVTAALLEKLPAAEREMLSRAAHQLDIAGIEEVIKEIRADHPEIADGLQHLAHEFRFGEILELLT
ncbi:MAG: response regulator [Candidatus Electrothrix sp. ATG2]|nr:response regulator [Candidatus Electrothrix sp. ATG2]